MVRITRPWRKSVSCTTLQITTVHLGFFFLSTDTLLHREKDFRCCTLRDLESVSRKNTPFPYMHSPVQLYSEPSQSFSRNLAFPPSIRDTGSDRVLHHGYIIIHDYIIISTLRAPSVLSATDQNFFALTIFDNRTPGSLKKILEWMR